MAAGRHAGHARGVELAQWIVGAYLLVTLLGFMALKHPMAMVRGNELSADRALFSAVNAATLSGFQQSISINDYQRLGRATIFVLTLTGTIVTLLVAGMAIARLTRLHYTDAQIAAAAMGCAAAGMIIGAAVLISPGRPLFDSAFLGLSAVGNSGLAFGNLPDMADWRTHAALMPLAVVGTLGAVVLLDLFNGVGGGARLSSHTRLVLISTAIAYMGGMLVLTLVQLPGPWREVLAGSSAQAINARTSGFSLAAGEFGSALQWILVLLMIVGGASGGTAGGIKTNTLYELARGVRRALAGAAPGRLFGIAAVWLAAYMMLVTVTLVLLVVAEPQMPADRLLFLAVSAASNVGLSHDPLSTTGAGLFVLTGAMLVGRLLPLLVLWWAAMTVRHADAAVA
jgi:trk system potassium uptake protein TrkH